MRRQRIKGGGRRISPEFVGKIACAPLSFATLVAEDDQLLACVHEFPRQRNDDVLRTGLCSPHGNTVWWQQCICLGHAVDIAVLKSAMSVKNSLNQRHRAIAREQHWHV